MSDLYEIHLRRIDNFDRKLFVFYIFAREELKATFRVTKHNTQFELRVGVIYGPSPDSFTDIHFHANLTTDLAIFEKEIPPIIKTDYLTVLSAESVQLDQQKEAERKNIEEQLRKLFPEVVEAVNTFRRACRIALFRDAVEGRTLMESIYAQQRQRGVAIDHSLQKYFDDDDAEFLFGAFADLTLTTFKGDAVIEYKIKNALGQEQSGHIKDGYRGLRSTNKFPAKLDDIQQLIDGGWDVETEGLLAAFEFLYSGNFRMAVFNAATILELAVVKFWKAKETQLLSGTRQDKEKGSPALYVARSGRRK